MTHKIEKILLEQCDNYTDYLHFFIFLFLFFWFNFIDYNGMTL